MTRRGIQGVLVVCGALLVLLVVSAGPVFAHGGGIDSNGGHHCREAGFNSGKCAPLNSYHCHQPGCDPAGPGGSSGGSGDGGGGSTPSPPPRSTPTPAPAPQSTPTPRSTPAPRPAPPDTTPPDAPLLGRARVDGGTVTLPVTAEQGAQLRFVAAGARVHTATATGEQQDVSFTLADGRHAVSVTATDAAGNTSDPTTFRINVDTTAPDPPEQCLYPLLALSR